MEGLDLGQDKEVTYPGTKGFNNDSTLFSCNTHKYKQKPKLIKKVKNESVYEKTHRLKIEKLHMPYGKKADKKIDIKGSYLEDIPDINNILNRNIKAPPKLYTME